MESLHQQFLEDETPENERLRLDPDHWYENNLCNSSLFANLAPEKIEGMEPLVPGRIFTTRMPRDLVEDPSERKDWLEKVQKNNLKVICVLTEPHEFEKYSGMDGLLEFYENECGLKVYNRAIPDFEIPTSGDLVNNILDLTYHLSQGQNCLIHCAGGTGRTGMVLAAVIQNLGVYDTVSKIRKVKSTYVETPEQEKFLANMPKAIDSRIVADSPMLACAIAAEHLIQVFHTHKSKIEKSDCKNKALNEIGDAAESLEGDDEEKLKEAYGQVFDLLDEDKSGVLDRSELSNWFEMCGAEIDVKKITEVSHMIFRTILHSFFIFIFYNIMAHKYSYKNISYSDHARRRKVDSSQIHQNDEGFGGKPSTRLRYFRKWAFGWPWIRRNSPAKFET